MAVAEKRSVTLAVASGILFSCAAAIYFYLLLEGLPHQPLRWVTVVLGGVFFGSIWLWRGLSGARGLTIGLVGSYIIVPLIIPLLAGFASGNLEGKAVEKPLLDFQGVQRELLKVGIDIREQRLDPDNVYGKVNVDSSVEINGVGDAGIYGAYYYAKAISQVSSSNQYVDKLRAIGWFEILDLETLSSEENLPELISKVDQVIEMTVSEKMENIKRLKDQPGEIGKLEFTPEFKSAFLQGLQVSLSASIEQTVRYWDLEIEIIEAHKPVIQMWDAGAAFWSEEKARVLFSDQATEAHYRGLLEMIQSLREQKRAESENRLMEMKKAFSQLSQSEVTN